MKMTLTASVLTLVIACPVATAHHSKAAFYELDTISEVEGEVTRVLWRNPHIRFWVETSVDGKQTTWEVESTPPGILERHGIGPDVLVVGQTIRIAGTPGRNNLPTMDVTNILIPDGREVLIQRNAEPRWSDRTIGWGQAEFSNAEVAAAETQSAGIFRVWSRDFSIDREPFGQRAYPLTEAARIFQQGYDPVADNPIPGCTPKGMPYIMNQPYPVEFIDEGSTIFLRIEEYDLVRTIHMGGDLASAPDTSLGHSLGHWDGRALVVTTSAMLSPYFNSAGILLSDAAHVEERFELSQDNGRLNYRLTVTDPATFTEPVSLERYWLWRPGEAIQPFECVEAGGLVAAMSAPTPQEGRS